ncbi:MAG: hypothetical protein COU10_02030 [Candidatus Harrisonbacteria bacterium CG10_big_fil_rev_8_21_14_0_10_45_28]|uniref:Spore protein YkvP/CgeB glycosyl transferase-like domain-containing protein n=1 Tax=Candidatus Harrisonbacteria bacterium CG10_big_fil_rev_8_21_14_0_10_45_28 TaxID=1974586 RepID=A0A2H0UNE9_9BACT|nr:MAG: hypothetical protein COU10_02030 [Candidatus Harrisonbacteria bacterium CG10_big_fil_rev_8_21_14_0_10_45_28]
MKILIGGDIAQGGTIGFCVDAFKAIGVEAELFNYREHFRISFLNKALNKFRKIPHYFGVSGLNKKLLEKTQDIRPDFVLLFKPILVMPKTVKKLTKLTKVFSWYPDYIPFTKTCSAYFYKSIPFYDCHFSFNFANVEELKKKGAKLSLFLPCAADPDYHTPIKASDEEKKELGADVVFMGTYAKEKRSEYLERLCGDGYDIKIYGDDWERHPQSSCLWRKKCIQSKTLYGKDMSKIFNASKIVLAFVREHNKETLACRTYEIPISGGFMLHQRTAKTDEVFKEGEEAEFFGSYEELKKKIDFYLKNESLREKMIQKGRERVLREDLFLHRVQRIIEVFKELM